MTSKERATLRKHANGLETVYYIGKDGIEEAVVKGIREALTARELIKIKCQEGCPIPSKEAAYIVADKLAAEAVQVIGQKFVLYKKNSDINKYGI